MILDAAQPAPREKRARVAASFVSRVARDPPRVFALVSEIVSEGRLRSVQNQTDNATALSEMVLMEHARRSLHEAVSCSDEVAVRRLLRENARLAREPDKQKALPIHYVSDSPAIARLLLAAYPSGSTVKNQMSNRPIDIEWRSAGADERKIAEVNTLLRAAEHGAEALRQAIRSSEEREQQIATREAPSLSRQTTLRPGGSLEGVICKRSEWIGTHNVRQAVVHGAANVATLAWSGGSNAGTVLLEAGCASLQDDRLVVRTVGGGKLYFRAAELRLGDFSFSDGPSLAEWLDAINRVTQASERPTAEASPPPPRFRPYSR